MSKPWPLRKSIVITRSNPFAERSVLGHRCSRSRRQTDRQTDRQSVSTLFRLWRNFFFFFFFLEHYSTLYKSSILWIFFLFFFLTVLNFLQNSYDDMSIILCAKVSKDSLDIFRQCPFNCRYEFLELEFQSFEVYHPRDDTFVSFTDQ